ncbi:hypothetical protein N657DRAFT_642346 [Parathielavia appendiculata]|uniref:Uncharacterized protein n=1 Tax=Parathielavia appendiculata TaxID=2587402 RepID=A0AAN6Z5R1_9PEZI|nr:hypothetical protein N657DRAFT_642346 [Parathielavia appendiculata]
MSPGNYLLKDLAMNSFHVREAERFWHDCERVTVEWLELAEQLDKFVQNTELLQTRQKVLHPQQLHFLLPIHVLSR